MDQDINLFYSGGSGGFFCLHLLILTDQYHCVFERHGQDFETVFQKQWNINNILDWKLSETWPNNSATAKSDIARKIYFFCNNIHEWEKYPGTKIVLYTDIKTQYFLAKTKRANWFADITDKQFAETYNKIRGYNWPDCNSKKEFDHLPQRIKDECINDFCLYPKINGPISDSVLTNYLYYKEDKVYSDLVKDGVFDQAKIIIKLQDLIKTKGAVLFNQLGVTGNNRTNEFVDQWLAKHTEEQLKYLLK